MFFLIAGVHSKQIVLDQTPRRCPTCGLFQARLVRHDYCLSLFFLPLFRVKKGATALECRRCGAQSTADLAGGFEFSGAEPIIIVSDRDAVKLWRVLFNFALTAVKILNNEACGKRLFSL